MSTIMVALDLDYTSHLLLYLVEYYQNENHAENYSPSEKFEKFLQIQQILDLYREEKMTYQKRLLGIWYMVIIRVVAMVNSIRRLPGNSRLMKALLSGTTNVVEMIGEAAFGVNTQRLREKFPI